MTQPPEDQPTHGAPRDDPRDVPPPAQPQPGPYGAPGARQWPVTPPSRDAQQPYQQPFQQPSPYRPPSSSGVGRTIAVVVGVVGLVLLLVCGGVVALVVWAFDNVEDALDEFDPERRGGRGNPIAVRVGEEFEIDGIHYARGWSVEEPADELDAHDIVGLRGTNDRDDESAEAVHLTFTFVAADGTEVGRIPCTSDGHLAHGDTEELDCDGIEELSGDYDLVEVAASS